MRVAILTPHLKVEAIGTESWRLLEPLAFRVECDEHPEPFVFAVPGGYDTDFESVPKLIFWAYLLIKGRFKRPATGQHTGPCKGWAIDHVIPLAVGGCDAVSNLQWLPVEIKSCAGTVCKDRWERKVYAR